MKRFLSFALALVMMLSASGLLGLSVTASDTVSSGASAETPAFTAVADKTDPAAGETVKITVSAKNIPVHSIGVTILQMEGFEFSKGSWVTSALKAAKVEDPDPDEPDDWATPIVSSNLVKEDDTFKAAVSTYDDVQQYDIDGKIFTLTLNALSGSRALLIEVAYSIMVDDDEIKFTHYLPLFGAETPNASRIFTVDRVGLLDGAKKVEIVLSAKDFSFVSLGVDVAFDSSFSFSKGTWISSSFKVARCEDPDPDDDGDWIMPVLSSGMKLVDEGSVEAAAITYSAEDGEQTVSGDLFKLTLNVNGAIDRAHSVRFEISYQDADDNYYRFSIPVVISKHTHEWEIESVIEPGCTETGYTVFVCPGCGEHKTGETTSALGHDYGEWTVTAEPTCTENGVKEKVCSRCGDVQTESIAKLGHIYASETHAPTCTEMGYTIYTCDRCGDKYVGATTAALGHDYGEWTVTAEPTCTGTGSKERSCTRCGVKDVAVISALGHDYTVVVTPATCTEKGYTTYTCARCGETYTDSYIDALNHDYASVTVVPTCTEEGYVLHTCSRCGDNYKTDRTAALGHDCTEWTVVTAPTCTEEGTEQAICARCGETVTRSVPVIAHDYEAVVTAPTCTEKGYTTYTCKVCGANYISDRTSALGHDYGEWTVTTEPTCTENGVKERVCSRCGTKDTSAVGALGHDYRFADFEWEGFDAKAVYVCAHDASHVQKYAAAVSSEITLDSTCEGEGTRTYTAVYNGHYGYKTESITATGHTYGEWQVVTAPTEEAEGSRVKTCSVCGGSVTEIIPLLSEANGYVKSVGIKAKMSAEGVMNWTHAEYGVFTTPIPKLPSKLSELLNGNYILYYIGNTQYVLIKKALATLPEGVAVRDTNGYLCTSADQTFGHVIDTEEDGKIYDAAVIMILGDYSGDGKVTSIDAVLLLRHTLFPEKFPLNQSGDLNHDGKVTSIDAVLLLRYTLFPDKFSLSYPD